jgi:hypothetical protein
MLRLGTAAQPISPALENRKHPDRAGDAQASALTGGGLIRSHGGWKAVKSMRRRREHVKSDERILGDSDFVQSVLSAQNEQLEAR